jgi:hypothetical protein
MADGSSIAEVDDHVRLERAARGPKILASSEGGGALNGSHTAVEADHCAGETIQILTQPIPARGHQQRVTSHRIGRVRAGNGALEHPRAARLQLPRRSPLGQ